MRMAPLLVVAAILLAGCSGESKQAKEEGDDFNVDGEDQVDLGGFGALAGRVHDPVNRSIRGVAIHVLTEDQMQGKTDRDGNFRIDEITPGEYKIHVFHESYEAKAFTVQVEADKILHLTIELRLLESLCAACSPHAHDHWRGETKIRVMDSQNDIRERPGDSGVLPPLVFAYGMLLHPNLNSSSPAVGHLYPLAFEGGDDSRPPIILPGTGSYELTLSWDETEIQTDDLGVRVWPMGNESHEYWIYPIKNGETVTRTVPIDESDNGHQAWTFWRFWYFIPNDATDAPDYSPMAALGSVNAQMDVIKGEEPYLEPGHPDFWGNQTEYVFAEGSWDRSLSLTHPSGTGVEPLHEVGTLVWPGADRMLIEFSWQAGDGMDNLGPHILRWRTGEQNPVDTTVLDYKTAPGTDCGPRCIVYELELSSEETDQYYYKDSNWRFYAYPEYAEDTGLFQDSSLKYTVKATVYKDP